MQKDKAIYGQRDKAIYGQMRQGNLRTIRQGNAKRQGNLRTKRQGNALSLQNPDLAENYPARLKIILRTMRQGNALSLQNTPHPSHNPIKKALLAEGFNLFVFGQIIRRLLYKCKLSLSSNTSSRSYECW